MALQSFDVLVANGHLMIRKNVARRRNVEENRDGAFVIFPTAKTYQM